MRKVTLQQEIAAAFVLKQAKWEKMGGWQDPTSDKRPSSKLFQHVLRDIRERKSLIWGRNDPDQKLRDSIKRCGIHRGIIRNAITKSTGNTFVDVGTDEHIKRTHRRLVAEIRNMPLQIQAACVTLKSHRNLMTDIRKNKFEKKFETPTKPGQKDETTPNQSILPNVETGLDEDSPDVMSDITHSDPVLAYLDSLEHMIKLLSDQMQVLRAHLGSLVSNQIKSKGKRLVIVSTGVASVASPYDSSPSDLISGTEKTNEAQADDNQDDWVDVL